jgi:hypothetical protein
MADPRMPVKLKFEWHDFLKDLLAVHVHVGHLKFEMILTYEMALQYILYLRIISTEPRTRKMEN